MLEKFNVPIEFFKELINSKNLAVHLSTATAFGIGVILVLFGSNTFLTIIAILFVFSICMATSLGIEKIGRWRKNKKKQSEDLIQRKLGLLGDYRYTYEFNKPWPDQNHIGMGWVILVDEHTKAVFLQNPVCLRCKTNLIHRYNENCTGIYLECTDCKARFEVDDVGEKRALAHASLQGDVRKNPDKYFRMRI